MFLVNCNRRVLNLADNYKNKMSCPAISNSSISPGLNFQYRIQGGLT